MRVKLLFHTQMSESFKQELGFEGLTKLKQATDGQILALTAIRTCYSHRKPSEIAFVEGEKYFGDKGKESKRLFKHIVSSGHTSTLEGITFTFAIEGVSRALLAQLTRHRHFSFSVQSQRYVKLSSDSRSGGFDCITPLKIQTEDGQGTEEVFDDLMAEIQIAYDKLISMGIPQEDARSILPNAAVTNLVMTANLRSLLDFYQKRKKGNGAQQEITVLADKLKNRVIEVEPWTEEFFANE